MKSVDVSLPTLAQEVGGTWLEAFPLHLLPEVKAKQFGEVRADFISKLDAIIPAVGVSEDLPRMRVIGEHAFLETDGGLTCSDASWFRGHVDQRPPYEKIERSTHLAGKCLSIASDNAATSYGHFVQDCLPRLAILDKLSIDPNSFDHIICSLPSPQCARYLRDAGIDEKKLVPVARGVALRPETLTVTTFPGIRRWMEPWSANLIRSLAHNPKRRIRRLFINRKATRRIANFDEVSPILERYGFQSFYPEDEPDTQARTSSEAETVIGIAGSAMANLAFCRPGTKVLELLPTDHVFPYYCGMSFACGLSYHYLVGKSLIEREAYTIGPGSSDFEIRPDVLEMAIAHLTSSAGRQPAHRDLSLVPASEL